MWLCLRSLDEPFVISRQNRQLLEKSGYIPKKVEVSFQIWWNSSFWSVYYCLYCITGGEFDLTWWRIHLLNTKSDMCSSRVISTSHIISSKLRGYRMVCIDVFSFTLMRTFTQSWCLMLNESFPGETSVKSSWTYSPTCLCLESFEEFMLDMLRFLFIIQKPIVGQLPLINDSSSCYSQKSG